MTDEFDRDYWEQHWHERAGVDGHRDAAPNPHLVREIADLDPGTALDAGCGEGTEALWLAARGWSLTAADISPVALARARTRESRGASAAVDWIEADLCTWEPTAAFDLVITLYAHPAIPQLDFYERVAQWVAPGGTLLIVGHLHRHHHDANDHHPPDATMVTSTTITDRLRHDEWKVVTAFEAARERVGHDGQVATWHDVIVRATRLR